MTHRGFPCAQTEQDGTVVIAGPDEASVQAAAAKIRAVVSEVEIGAVYRHASACSLPALTQRRGLWHYASTSLPQCCAPRWRAQMLTQFLTLSS